MKGRRTVFAVVIMLMGVMITPFPLWAGEVSNDDLKKALDEKDRQIRMLMERVERLEQQIGQKPTPVAATAAAAPAEEKDFQTRVKDAFHQLLDKTPSLAFFRDVQLSGFVTTTVNYNLSGASAGGFLADRRNDFRYNDIEANQFILDMAELQLIKPSTDESRFGFGLTLDYGSSIRTLQAAGFGTPDPLRKTTNAFDFRQAYATYKFPLGRGLEVKAGKFDTPLGMELLATAYNLNTSHGLLYWITPATHTGFVLTYPFTDQLTATAGIVNGWDVADDNNRDKTFLGFLSMALAKNLTLTAGGIYGPEQGSFLDVGGAKSNANKRWLADFVLYYLPTDKLTVQLNLDWGAEENSPFSFPVAFQDMDWWGISGIAKYQFTPEFSVATRAEFMRDDDGAVVFKDFAGPDFHGFPQSLWEVTLTGEYKFSKNFRTRLEYRHDQSDERTFRGTPGAVTPDGGRTQDTMALEATVLF